MTAPMETVRRLWERFEARDFDGAGELLAEDVVIDWPVTSELIRGRASAVELNRSYPEPWGHIRAVELFPDGDRVAARVRIDAPGVVVACLGVYEVRDGRITRGTEYWVDEASQEPPHDRSRWAERT